MTIEPQIRYAKTADGVSIAYWTMGRGAPFLHLPLGVNCHIEYERQIPGIARWYELLASRYTLIRYDSRGYGASDRSPAEISLETMLLDIEAVVDSLQLDNITVFGAMIDGAIACAYAAKHPQRVSNLILWNASAAGTARPEQKPRAIDAIMDEDWRAFTDAYMRELWGWSRAVDARLYAKLLRTSTDPATHRRQIAAFPAFDVRPVLSSISARTLVVHHPAVIRERRLWGQGTAQALASSIKDARLMSLDGRNFAPWIDVEDANRGFSVSTQFIDGDDAQLQTAPHTTAFRTVLFTDMVGHTEMMQRLGDAKGRDVLREHERITRETLKQHSGAEVKTMGDGFMASFGSVTQAMECAVALQRAFASHSEKQGEPLHVRVGLNAGEPIEEDGDLFGATVILASRIAAKAAAGEILIPEPVRHLLSGKAFAFSDRGEFAMKGFDDAVRLYEVRWQE